MSLPRRLSTQSVAPAPAIRCLPLKCAATRCCVNRERAPRLGFTDRWLASTDGWRPNVDGDVALIRQARSAPRRSAAGTGGKFARTAVSVTFCTSCVRVNPHADPASDRPRRGRSMRNGFK
jgi:hypothetical protein